MVILVFELLYKILRPSHFEFLCFKKASHSHESLVFFFPIFYINSYLSYTEL